MVKAIILDWSGVVSDDLNVVYGITSKLFSRLGKKFMSLPEFREKFDLPFMDFYRKMGVGLDKGRLEKMYEEIFYENGIRPKPFPFAGRTLTMLNKRGIKLAVLSAHPQHFLEKEIADYGFSHHFSYVFGGVHDKRKEIKNVLKKMGTDKNETLFVGDMTHDLEAGSGAGILTAAVLSGYHSREKLASREPNFIMNDLRDLRFVVDGVFA